MRRVNAVLSLAALVLIAILSCQSERAEAAAKWPDRTLAGWHISAGDERCSAGTSFEDNTVFLLFYDWRDDDLWVAFTNEAWSSLADREGQEAPVEIQFNDESWTTGQAQISSNGFLFRIKEEEKIEFLAYFSVENRFVLVADEKNLGAFTLKGSKTAVSNLMDCMTFMRRHDRSDPFAD